VKHALETYVDGQKLDIGSRGLLETANARFDEEHKKRELLQLDIKDEDKVCEACGAVKRKDGSPLLLCGRCKQVKYCSRECQKERFKEHKVACGNS
jgi:hypothetical protein